MILFLLVLLLVLLILVNQFLLFDLLDLFHLVDLFLLEILFHLVSQVVLADLWVQNFLVHHLSLGDQDSQVPLEAPLQSFK